MYGNVEKGLEKIKEENNHNIEKNSSSFSFSGANTLIANITKAPFKKCSRNVNELVE